MTDKASSGLANLARRLSGRRLLARLAILFEGVWPALWPPLGLLGLFACLALLGLPELLPASLHLALLVILVLGVLALAFRGLRGVRLPDDRAADRRLETSSGLVHRPLSVLTDRPAVTDSLVQAVWRAHTDRAMAQVGRLRVGLPRPGLARRDPRALRYALLLCIVVSLVIAGVDAPTRLLAALSPAVPVPPGVATTELQAWITPPTYTRVAPIFLRPQGGAVSVPAGSHLTVNVSGGTTLPTLSLNERSAHFSSLDSNSFQAEWDLTRGGLLTVRRDSQLLAAWTLTVIADQPPTAAWGENPGRAASGQQTRLPWQVSDDYGVTGLQAEIRLRDRPEAPPLVVTIPLPGGNPKDAHGVNQQDLTAHPWAGLPVVGRLIARDAINQTGNSTDETFELSERPFHNPVAQLLIAMRKALSLRPNDRDDAVQALDRLMQQPELFEGDAGAFVNLSAIYYVLVRERSEAAIPEAQSAMWELALHMEEGRTEQSARRLEEARRAARDALDRATQEPTDANRQALEKRLQELREAIDRHMKALTEESKRNNDLAPFDQNAAQLSNRDMNQKADQAEKAVQEGRMADAQQKIGELEKMLDQLRNARTKPSDGKQANGRRQRGKQQMGAVQDMIGREAGLLDHAQRRGDQGDAQPPGSSPDNAPLNGQTGQSAPGQPPTGGDKAAAEREADRRVQQALRRALGELMQQFGDLTGQVPPSLGEADQAMRDSIGRLGQGNDPAAGQSQQQAIAALQKGAKEMGQTMAKQSGHQAGQGGEEGDQDDSEGAMGMMMPDGQGRDGRGTGPQPGSPDHADPGGRDPLGRSAQGNSTDNADVTVPEERERQRTQAIQEELRRRGADQERPREELDYIDRLLKQF
jgi:uncharacterized protein (TIGR02302 family)